MEGCPLQAIDKYIQKFSNLNTDRGRHRWSAVTNHRAPHKPFLLLSVVDLFAQGEIKKNFIEPSYDLVSTFNGYWHAIMPLGSTTSMAYPFPRLKTDGFWKLIPNSGYESIIHIAFSSMVRLREVCAGARLDDDLFELLYRVDSRERLRAILIKTYFALEIRSVVAEQGIVNLAAYKYGQKLLRGVKESIDWGEKPPPEKARKVRDQGFRKAIVRLYEHRCALCGIRMVTPEGHTIVEAAHIVPWSETRDDRPANGLCLCRLCHWSFDEGLMSVGKAYEVLVSKRIQSAHNMPGHVLTLRDRPIFRPRKNVWWPSQDNLARHRKTTFK
jgi:putative restriction endonuclease